MIEYNREDLENYRYNQQWIKGRLKYAEEYATTINRLTAILSDAPKGSRQIQDTEAEKTTELMDSVKQLKEEILKENRKQDEIVKMVKEINAPYNIILHNTYILGHKLGRVCDEIHYSYSRTKDLHKEALNKFDEICKQHKPQLA